MPYKSKVKDRIYHREYMRRKRFNSKRQSEATGFNFVKPFVKPSKARGSKAKSRDDLMTELPGGEAMWGFDETQGEPLDDSLKTDLPGGEAWWGFDDTKK